MVDFKDREKGEEAKFAHDAQLRFRAEARRNKHLAHWACEQMSLASPEDKANYTAEVIAADMASAGFEDVVAKVAADFGAKGVTVGADEIRARIAQFDAQARQEILNEA